MIERLLEADRLLALGLTDQAERIYWQAVELDPRNAIAVVGLARVASERGDDRTALEFARKALEIDPESPAASRLAARFEEILVARGESVEHVDVTIYPLAPPVRQASPTAEAAQEPAPGPGPVAAEPAPGFEPAPGPEPAQGPAPAPAPPVTPAPAPRPIPAQKRESLLHRLLRGR
jgi:tetratricopeptide (TPR) repeat protein